MTLFLDGRVQLLGGDCREVLATLPDDSIDSIVCDPPYGLEFMGKDWDSFTGAGMTKPGIGERDIAWPSFHGSNTKRCRACGKLMGHGGSPCKCDVPQPYNAALPRMHGFQQFMFDVFCEAIRVLKPGGHVAAFGGTRTYHRLACAIEDAGFEIRDCLMWVYGSGFPKSLDVSKSIDKAAGAEREVVGKSARHVSGKPEQRIEGLSGSSTFAETIGMGAYVTAPSTDAAKQWSGFGTALKPAVEPICLARKPLIGTVAANVLRHGVGALNIDGCRIGTGEMLSRANNARPNETYNSGTWQTGTFGTGDAAGGRWPANLLHDGSDEVLACFPDTSSGALNRANITASNAIFGKRPKELSGSYDADSGSAARFFYTSKADADDRLGSRHPTVKPIDLMQWLVRLITPPGGTVLDPFAGTGTTGEAAWREGMKAILIEREPEYQADIARRMDLATQPTKRAAVARTKNNLDDPNSMPLFAGLAT